MHRRSFLELVMAAPLAPLKKSSWPTIAPEANTVLGPLNTITLGSTLMHEHVLVDFIGADKVSPSRYNSEEVFARALPHLKQLLQAGCRTLVECTPAYIGRDPALLARLSKASGLNLVTNTGYYGAAEDKFVPRHAYQETAEQLSRRWIREFKGGIEGSAIRPGIIKTGVDAGKLSEIDAKLVRAAALTHLQTGMTIASHTGDGVAALEQLSLLERAGVRADAFVWVHAQNEFQLEVHVPAARKGCWVEFDGIGESSLEQHVKLVRIMADNGLLGRTLVSQDAGWYHVGEPDGGEYRGYTFLYSRFLPELLKRGFSEMDVQKVMVENPRSVLTFRIRELDQSK